jgi:hypothetical protein
MNYIVYQQFRGYIRMLSATVGIGGMVVLGALAPAHQKGSIDPSPGDWQASTTITKTAAPPAPSASPTLKANYCDDESPHAWADGCPWGSSATAARRV